METRATIEMSAVISKVFIKMKKAIFPINNGDGWHDLVEYKIGKNHADIKFDFATNTANIEKIEVAVVNENIDSDNELMQDI